MFALPGLPETSRTAPSVVGLAAFVISALLLVAPAPRAAAARDEVRALWVTRVSLTTPRSVSAVVQTARVSGFNTLLVQVRGRGDAYFADALEPRADALAGTACELRSAPDPDRSRPAPRAFASTRG